jgi:hypothetical protein
VATNFLVQSDDFIAFVNEAYVRRSAARSFLLLSGYWPFSLALRTVPLELDLLTANGVRQTDGTDSRSAGSG